MRLRQALGALGLGLPAAMGCVVLTPLVSAHATPVIMQNFQGITFLDTSGLVPPDSNGAAGPNHFVELVNGGFAVYTKAGTLTGPVIADTQFWTNANAGIPAGTVVSDPRVIYDPSSQRWFASQITTDPTGNQVLVARSNSSDPTAGWKAVHFTGNSGFADFPTLGADANGVYIGVTNFTSSTGTSTGKVSFFSIPKSDLILGTPTIARMTKFENLDASVVGSALQPARDFGGPSGAILAIDNVSGTIDRTTVRGSGGPGATLSPTTKITGAADGTPILARQPDGLPASIDAGDNRLSASVFQVGSLLYGTNTISDNTATHDIVHWFILDAATNKLVHQGTIGDPNFDFFYPSIAANAKGDMLIAFNRSGGPASAPGCTPPSGSCGNISAFAELCSTAGGVVTCGSPFMLQAGATGDYHLLQDLGLATVERWGDYSTTTVDPSDPSVFWTVQEIPVDFDTWGTQITAIGIGPVPEPSTLVLTGLGFLGLAAATRRHRSKVRTRPQAS